MLRAGKVHWMIPVGAVGVLAVLIYALMPQESPQSVGTQFMDALARGDAKKLTELSYADESPEELQKKWEFTVTYPGKHYWFKWRVKSDSVTSEDQALVRMAVDIGKGYEDNFTLPMIRDKGHWKVDAFGLSRQLYPGLPRRDY